jgi:hypothetical protein
MAPRVLIATILLMTVLAGCTASNNGGNSTSGGSTPPTGSATVTNEQAQGLLATAATDLPEQVGVTMALTQGSATVLTITADFDNATQTSDITMTGDLGALVPATEAGAAGGQLPKSFEIFSTKTQFVLTANGTAFVLSTEQLQQFSKEAGGASGSGSPASWASAGSSPFAPHELFQNLTGANATVTSVTPTTWKGQSAVQVDAQITNGSGQKENVTVVLSTGSQPRILHLESSDIHGLPAGTRASADFAYGADVKVQPSPATSRAASLAYSSQPQQGDANGNVWTFTASGGVSPSDVQVVLKNASSGMGGSGGMASGMDYAKMPELFHVALSDAPKTQDGITVSYADNDHDGTVSKGDTVTITMGQDAPPATPILYDAKSGTYVVPGVGLLALVGVAAFVALALRRRAA